MKIVLSKDLFAAAAFGILSFLVALVIAWVFLAQQNFWYGLWHDHTSISNAIETYGPQNRHIRGFADTSREQRIKIFAEINEAVHHGGRGLTEISFETRKYGTQKLLRSPEVVHLQDVANLIDFLKVVVVFVVVAWLATLAWAYKNRALPSLRQQSIGTGIFVCISTLFVFLIGPKKVFNTLHIWVFPEENEWFFYYQDSLMSTLMEAPVLFAWIAGALLFWAIVFYFLLQLLVYRIFKQLVS